MKSFKPKNTLVSLLAFLTLITIPQGAFGFEEAPEDRFWDRIGKQIETSALLELEWTYGTAQGKSQNLEFMLDPELEAELPLDWDLTAIGRLRADVFDELVPGDPSQNERSEPTRRLYFGDRVELELREFYIEKSFDRAYINVGKQQVVWGQADGLKVLDVVNPQDFREFILDDFEDSRIPLWMLNMEIPIEDFLLQLLWIPDQTYHDLPESGALYTFTSPRLVPTPPPGVNAKVQSIERPNRFFQDSDAGFRISTFWKGWDLTLNYLYHYSDNPVLFQEKSITTSGSFVTVRPQYERSHLIGGTFSNAFGNLTIRGEVGFSSDRFFLTNNPNDIDGVVKTDELGYVIGFDWYGIEETLVSVQLFQSVLGNDGPGLTRDQVDTTVTLFLQREFLNDSLVPEILWLHNLNDSDGLVRPKVSYEVRDNIKVWVGADVFYGDDAGLFGQFNQNDRVVLGAEWGI